ncbi:MAG: hypothetical protein WAN50_05060 [Minisyncoccia bacterium]
MSLNKISIGKIAERIVMNELESRGYRTTDLNKDGMSANSDILAAKNGKTWQIQVKGATNKIGARWWIQYGHSDSETISGREPVFNRKDSFYTAQYVAFVAVQSPSKYQCYILPIKTAEKAAQINLNRGYRKPKLDGGEKKPGKMWTVIEKSDRERVHDPLLEKERKILETGKDAWNLK